MKLYATTTSERASKGQGGNTYLNTTYKFRDDSKEDREVVNIVFKKHHNRFILKATVFDERGYGIRDIVLWDEKAEKKKAEICYCQKSGLSIPHYSDDH